MPKPEDTVAARLDADRRALLDLSLKNPLLNHRPRVRSLEFAGESPEQVVRCLVREGRRMAFLPAAELKEPTESVLTTDQSDHKLQTDLVSEALRKRLLAIYYASRASIEEQGVNTLFLALGMLRRVEPGRDGVLRAPLILVPVELERSSARERFRLRHEGGDLETNLSLAAKLRESSAIELPEPPEVGEGGVTDYFDAVSASINEHEGWDVDRGAVVLGFFSFGKFLMYRDLDNDLWPDHARPDEHSVVKALLRDGFSAAAGEESRTEDEEAEALDAISPEACRHVVDADATQALALLDVARGRNLVIQGPPGSGKSQTITNLIAEAVGQGKTVLFVAEKLAALDVVKRRLEAAGLGDACLELHSQKTGKKSVLAELDRTRRVGKPSARSPADDFTLLASTRDRLNAYHKALHEPVGLSGVSPYNATVTTLGPPIPTPLPLELPEWSKWTPFEHRQRFSMVVELEACLGSIGTPRQHPFWGSRRTSWLPEDAGTLSDVLARATACVTELSSASQTMAEYLRIEPPADRAGCAALLRAAKRATRAVAFDITGPEIAGKDWLSRRVELQDVVDAGARLDQARHDRKDTLLPEAWGEAEAVAQARKVLNVEGRNWWRFLSPTYRKARATIAGLCRGVPPKTLEESLALADVVLEARRNRETIRDHDALASRVFGTRWQGEKSEWDHLALMSKWAAKFHHDVRSGRIPRGLVAFLANPRPIGPVRGLLDTLQRTLSRHHDAIKALSELLDFHPGEGAPPLLSRPFTEQLNLTRTCSDQAGKLPALASYNRAVASCRSAGLATVVSLSEVWEGASQSLNAVVERAGASQLLKEALRDRPALSGFDASSHERAIKAFADLDRQALKHNRARAAKAHWERIPRGAGGGGQLGVLLREFEKKSRHLPVRQLMARAGNAVQAIKPVFLMSPLSVAAYLAPGSLEFDLVVFDEASQVKPVDALGAILRGKQTVVVGDSRQLPPSSFFDRLTGGDDIDPDDDSDDASSDLESILGLFVASGAPERMLRWHYRSRHESLIAVSNRLFYDNRLVVFPSPDTARIDSGLRLRHSPETVYERGTTRTNPGEADLVALAVIDHARGQLARPPAERLSLGVAAFSLSQTGVILERLENLRRENPDCEAFFATGGAEPFFVKNLENVQGDERDVIFISVGYGRTASGDVPLNFGPLNGEGGERRLNVLITRAKVRCEVFTNLTAADIDLSRTRARGVAALKTFLAYAESGRLDDPSLQVHERHSEADHGLSAAILDALRAAGRRGRIDAGAEGVAPDLAVADLENPARDRLGLLFDNLAGQAGRPARDRDRLRPQVLEALGWKVHRTWSLDWARDPSGAGKRLLAALTNSEPVRFAEPPSEPLTTSIPVAESWVPEAERVPYRAAEVVGELDLASAPLSTLVDRIASVVAVESPVHRDQAFWRVAEGAGARRLGTKAQAALEAATNRAVLDGRLVVRGEFLWLPAMNPKNPPIRDRSAMDSDSRRAESVAPEEFEAAALAVVNATLGIAPTEIHTSVARRLGFPRVSEDLRARVDAAVKGLTADGRLIERGGHLVSGATE